MTTGEATCRSWGHAEWRGAWTNIQQDILRYLNKSPENQAVGDTFRSRLGALLTPQLLCLVGYRVAHCLHVKGWTRLADCSSRLNLLVHKVTIPAGSCIGPGCLLPHPAGVLFQGRAGSGLTMYSRAVCLQMASAPGGVRRGAPHLGNRVTVGGHTAVLGGVRVGDDVRMLTVRVVDDVSSGRIVTSRTLRLRRRSRIAATPDRGEAP